MDLCPDDATTLDTRADPEDVDAQYIPLLQLWILRAMLKCNGAATLLRETRFAEASVAEFLGFDVTDIDGYSPSWATRELALKLEQLENLAPTFPTEPAVARNTRRLAERLAFSPVESDILHFVVLQRIQPQLSLALELVGDLVRASLVRLLGVCLGHPERAIQDALKDGGRLCRSALLSVDDAKAYCFSNKVDLLEGFAETLTMEHDELLDLFSSSFSSVPDAELTLADYPHLADDIEVLRPYLELTCRCESQGVNILIHGVPGTGKTEFVKALAAAVGAQLMAVSSESPTGRPRAGKDRFESLRFAQSLLGGSGRHLILFDEVEDVFYATRGEGKYGGNSSGLKGWVNRTLECNPVPVVWVTNCLDHIDPAYRRRFDYVLKMEPPPSAVRRRLLDKTLGEASVSDAWRERAARHPSLTAATLQRAVKVASSAVDANPSLRLEQAIERAMSGSLEALNIRPLADSGSRCPDGYRLGWLNSDMDLQLLADGLVRERSGRVCLWGPPGTGKSEFARHVASLMDRPCLVRKASDLLSPYVGVAEKNIAQMFEQAIRDDAVLVLDEADSFLRQRRGAKQSWEVTQVNEMLTAMEGFEGVFIASTNLVESFDEAALRRFDVSAKLDFLKPHQAQELLAATACRLKLPRAPEDSARVSRLGALTPGDFASVQRGARLCRPRSLGEVVDRLAQLSASKDVACARTIGFV